MLTYVPERRQLRLFFALASLLCLLGASTPLANARQGSQASGIIQTSSDFDGDGVSDQLVLDPGWNDGEPVYGRVIIRSGANSTIIRSIVGPEPADLFGFAATSIGDIDGDGVPDLAIAAPRGGVDANGWADALGIPDGSDPGEHFGRIRLYSGATGGLIRSFAGGTDELFAFGVIPVTDIDGDGRNDILVRIIAPDPTGMSPDGIGAYRAVSSATGETLAWGYERDLVAAWNSIEVEVIWNAADPATVSFRHSGDLNADGSVDQTDLLQQLENYGQSGWHRGRGDLEGNNSISLSDVGLLVAQIGLGSAQTTDATRAAAGGTQGCCKPGGGCENQPRCRLGYHPSGSGNGSGTTTDPGSTDTGGGATGGDPCHGCPSTDCNCNGIPDSCEADHITVRADVNNDDVLDGQDDAPALAGQPVFLVIPDFTSGDPSPVIDSTELQVLHQPAGIESWEAIFPEDSLILTVGGTVVRSGVSQPGSMPAAFTLAATSSQYASGFHSVRFVATRTDTRCPTLLTAINARTVRITAHTDPALQPATQLEILPGDSEKLTIQHNAGADAPYSVWTHDKDQVRLLTDAGLATNPVALPAEDHEFELFGFAPIRSYAEVRKSSGRVVWHYPVRVGGGIQVRWSGVPTFKVTPCNPAIEEGRGDPITQSRLGRGLIPADTITLANALPAQVATVTVFIHDPDGNGRPGKEVQFLFRRGLLAEALLGRGPLGFTDDEGKLTTTISAVDTEVFKSYQQWASTHPQPGGYLPWQEWQGDLDRVGILIGRAARLSSDVSNPDAFSQQWDRTDRRFDSMTFKGRYFELERALQGFAPDEPFPAAMQLFDLPLLNHAIHEVIRNTLVGGILVDDLLPPNNYYYTFDSWTQLAGTPSITSALQSLPQRGVLAEVGDGVLRAALRDRLLSLSISVAALEYSEDLNQADLSGCISVIASEIRGDATTQFVWSALPIAPQVCDLAYQLIVVPLTTDHDIDNWAVLQDLFFLAFDLAFIEVGGTKIGARLAGWVGSKLCAHLGLEPMVARALLALSSNDFLIFARRILLFTSRLVGPTVTDLTLEAIRLTSVAISQLERACTFVMTHTANGVALAIVFVTERMLKPSTPELLEGAARIMSYEELETATRALEAEVGEDVTRSTLNLGGHLLPEGCSLAAYKGLAVAVETLGVDGEGVIRDILQGVQMSPTRIDRFFSNISHLKEVIGLDEMLVFMQRNANNLDGCAGAVYESTVAAAIQLGLIPEAGTLLRVSADELRFVVKGVEKRFSKIDTTTERWAIQIKSKSDPSPLVPSEIKGAGDSGAAYLDSLKEQANILGKVPALIINRPPNAVLQQMLIDRGIVWKIISE